MMWVSYSDIVPKAVSFAGAEKAEEVDRGRGGRKNEELC